MKQVDIKGWEQYQVTDDGRVWSKYYNKWLKPCVDRYGYPQIHIQQDGKLRVVPVHRLVAEAFIPNPDNKPCVDHINTEKTDNRVENLRWCTHKENCNNPLTKEHKSGNNHPLYGKHLSEETKRKMSETKKGKPSPLKGRKMSEFYCQKNREAQLKLYENGYVNPNKGKKKSEITKQKLREIERSEEWNRNISLAKKGKPNLKLRKKVLQFSKEGDFIREWDSVSEAQKEYNLSNGSIASVCNGKLKTTGGFFWRYAD